MQKQTGSIHAVAIIVLTLGLIGAVGFIFWQNFINKPKTDDKSTSSMQSKEKPLAAKDASVQPVNDTKYLVVKEWGVKFPYTSDDTLEYKYDRESSSISITSKKLAAVDGSDGSCGAADIGRGTAHDPLAADGVGPSPTLKEYYDAHKGESVANRFTVTIGKFGNYYYSFVHNNGGCSSDAELESTVSTLTQSIVPKVQGIE